MNGSEKQIKKAIAIKADIKKGFEDTKGGNDVFKKAIDFILNIDDANFWIDCASGYEIAPVRLVMKFAKSGLRIKGLGFADIARIDQHTGDITLCKIES